MLEMTLPSQHLVIGDDAIKKLPAELESLGVEKPLLVCSPRMFESSLVKEISNMLSIPHERIYAEVSPHPTVDVIEKGVSRARASKIDGFVSVGGGSASDTAKAIMVLLSEGGSISDHASKFIFPDTYIQKSLRNAKIPLIAVPTTASGAEVSFATAVTNGDVKLLISDPKISAKSVIYDLGVWRNIPTEVLHTSLFNAVAHDIECAYSRMTNRFSQSIAIESFYLIHQVIESGMKKSICFPNLPLGVAMSGIVMQNARVGVHHAICHAIGAYVGCSHANANAVMLPVVLEFNREEAVSVLARFERSISSATETDEKLSKRFVQRIRQMQQTLGVPTHLSQIGITDAHIDRIAELAASDRGTFFNPRKEDDMVSQIKELLKSAM